MEILYICTVFQSSLAAIGKSLQNTATHFPTMPHPDFEGRSGKGAWGDLLMQIDSYTGELLDNLETLGAADNTIFIFTADNGPEALSAGAGGRGPDDRVIDGIDMSAFLLGRTDTSGREGFIVYMGNDVFGVKWRDWKLHFKEQTGWNGVLRTYTMPRIYNLVNDPQERDNVLFPHTWVPKAALSQLERHVASLQEHPPIPPGAKDPYTPPD